MPRNIVTLMDQFFDETFRPVSGQVGRMVGINPALNVTEFENRYEISLTIPGIDPNQVKVELNGNSLDVSYDHKDEKTDQENGQILRQEYSHYSFSRRVALPKNIEADSLKAKYSKGLLIIKVNKIPEPEPKKITIETEE
jgi:HSP20 family protein